jgi:dTMP kinase
MEQQDLEFYRRVREGYLGLAERHPERVRIINAHRSAELVRKDIEAEVSRLLFRERP